VPLGRGALFHLLRSRIYRGQIPHKDTFYPGAHAAIVDAALFEQAGAMLAAGTRRSTVSQRRVAGALLTGRIVDPAGAPMSPAFSYGRSKRVYRYYVSASMQQGSRHTDDIVRRVSAPAIEALVTKAMERLHPAGDLSALKEVRLGRHGISLTLPASIRPHVQERLGEDEELDKGSTGRTIVVSLPVAVPLRGGARSIVSGLQNSAAPDLVLIGALRRAHAMLGRANTMPTMAAAPTSPYDRRILRLAFLAPDIQRSILAGLQPPHINLEYLLRQDISLDWSRQAPALGW
jgi:site-specific DNA recombinase